MNDSIRIKIRDWDSNFEQDRSRTYRSIKWVPVPNKQGAGYRKIMKHKKGLEIYACWIALVLQGSLCTPRGDLSKYSIEDLSLLTLIPEEILLQAIDFLSYPLDWVEKIPTNSDRLPTNLDNSVYQSPVVGSVLSNSVLCSSIQDKGCGEKDSEIEQIYQAYPKHVGKGQAFRAIKAALKKIHSSSLLDAVNRYSVSVAGKDPQFIPHPSTWFNGERWLDEPEKGLRDRIVENANAFMEMSE